MPWNSGLSKDKPGRSGFITAAIDLARRQVKHEWCRFVNLIQQSPAGDAGVSKLYDQWVDDQDKAQCSTWKGTLDWKSTFVGHDGNPFSGQHHTGEFTFKIKTPSTVPNIGADEARTDEAITGNGRATVNSWESCGPGTHSGSSVETFSVQGTFDAKSEKAKLQITNVKPDLLESGGKGCETFLSSTGFNCDPVGACYPRYDPNTFDNDLAAFKPLEPQYGKGNYLFGNGYNPSTTFDFDLSTGHSIFEKIYTPPLPLDNFIVNVKLTVDRVPNEGDIPSNPQTNTVGVASLGGESDVPGTTLNKLSASRNNNSNSVLLASDQSVTIKKNIDTNITLAATSPNPNADLTATIRTNPEHGTLSQINRQTGIVIYTPNQDYVGSDKFTFKVSDGKQDSSNVGTVSININDVLTSSSSSSSSAIQNNNNLLSATDQSVTTDQNKAADITLGGTSSNQNIDLSATIVTNPQHGTLSQINQNTGVVTYTPKQDYVGPDKFEFKVSDGKTTSSNPGIVSINVNNLQQQMR